MKKYSLIILFLISFCSFSSFAQTFIIQVKTSSGKWGYVNLKGEFVIPADFDNCEPFSDEGFTFVVKNEIPSIINLKGEVIPTEISGFAIQGLFTTGPKGFSSGLIAVTLNKKWGYLNSKGKLAIPLKYDYATTFENGFATVKIGTTFFVLDSLGNQIAVPAGVKDLKRFSEGLAPFESADKKMGFLNTKGEIAIPAEFNNVGYFSDSYVWVRKASDKKFGLINAKGEWAIQASYDGLSDFDSTSKMVCVKEGEKWSYVDFAGNKTSIPKPYDPSVHSPFHEGLAACWVYAKEIVGFINVKGETVIRPQYDQVRNFKNGYAAARIGGKWGVIDTAGNWVIKPLFVGMKDVELIN